MVEEGGGGARARSDIQLNKKIIKCMKVTPIHPPFNPGTAAGL